MSAPVENKNGKAPQGSDDRNQNGLVNVQPPRAEDLQPSYARQIQPTAESPAAHGWYAGFSKSQQSDLFLFI